MPQPVTGIGESLQTNAACGPFECMQETVLQGIVVSTDATLQLQHEPCRVVEETGNKLSKPVLAQSFNHLFTPLFELVSEFDLLI